ncbi:hypothetical protein CH63R_07610 [Colletotrichum higginsianum IMI 349063]|uniref:Uncharacterized protein n=1 Tax=Colletotrichum higginsianum (strain IMI 349063) TaxID=759273 RepID=A0A1B7YA69_COLHI|nr:hypothetical protein CH63R_07610 [Colletotrichum higginsianum IMI 349063]OBR08845.1 hypothetical protein CH63R_07610 [Colletotrichum higginsianum IMI 349063]
MVYPPPPPPPPPPPHAAMRESRKHEVSSESLWWPATAGFLQALASLWVGSDGFSGVVAPVADVAVDHKCPGGVSASQARVVNSSQLQKATPWPREFADRRGLAVEESVRWRYNWGMSFSVVVHEDRKV